MSTTKLKATHTKWAIEVEEDAKYPGNFRLYAQSPVVPARFHIGTALGAAVPMVSVEEAKANAILWSSAPDMLEALEDLVTAIPILSNAKDKCHVEFAAAVAAIAKAKGGAA